MRINYDCVRDLLISLEELLVFDDSLQYPSTRLAQVCSFPLMINYSKADIAYSSLMLDEAGYGDFQILNADDSIVDIIYSGITFNGHQYLDGIKSSKVWTAVKQKVGDGAASLTFDLIKAGALAIGKSIFL